MLLQDRTNRIAHYVSLNDSKLNFRTSVGLLVETVKFDLVSCDIVVEKPLNNVSATAPQKNVNRPRTPTRDWPLGSWHALRKSSVRKSR